MQIMCWFIKISLVDTTEMREILVTRWVSGRSGSLPRAVGDLAGLPNSGASAVSGDGAFVVLGLPVFF